MGPFGGAEQGYFGATPPPDQPGLASAMNPGGGPQESGDPLQYGINMVVAAIQKLANEAAGVGDEAFSNELEAIKNKLVRRKLNRQKAIGAAAEKGALTVAANQM